MTDLDAILILEGDETADEDTQYSAIQHLIDTGTVWSLQGSYGRAAAQLIEQGICTPAEGR